MRGAPSCLGAFVLQTLYTISFSSVPGPEAPSHGHVIPRPGVRVMLAGGGRRGSTHSVTQQTLPEHLLHAGCRGYGSEQEPQTCSLTRLFVYASCIRSFNTYCCGPSHMVEALNNGPDCLSLLPWEGICVPVPWIWVDL